MNNLLQALVFAAKKITKNNNATLRDLETLLATEIVEEIGPDGQPTGNVNEQPITFKALMDRYEKNADEALKAYKRRRALTALKS
ncbi:MAG: hypothetical protein K6E76_02310 [Patescibacteria group bacterium]|nr:hypothetical protein [Patescibacteria group bacterium]